MSSGRQRFRWTEGSPGSVTSGNEPSSSSFNDNGSGTKKNTAANGYPAITYGLFPNFTSTALKGGNITVNR